MTVVVPRDLDSLQVAELLNNQQMPDGSEYVATLQKADHELMIWQYMEMDERDFGEAYEDVIEYMNNHSEAVDVN